MKKLYIIELDESIYKGIADGKKADKSVEPREVVRSFQATIADAIANGTPYNPSGDCISREAVRSKIWKERVEKDEGCNSEYIRGLKTAIGFIDNASVVEPERLKDEWLSQGYGYFCSICHIYHENSNFCPNCGADMRKGGAK